jgi:energy-coupling factor transport system permease protein
MKNIIIGQYIPGKSFLYKMDPRSKLTILFIIMVTAFIVPKLLHMFILLGVMLLILQIGGLKMGRILKGLRPVLILLLFTFSFQIVFVKTGPELLAKDLSITLYNLPIMIGIIVIWFFTRRFVRRRFTFLLLTIFSVLALLNLFTPGNVLSSSTFTIYQDGVLNAVFIMTRLVIIITMSTILTLTTKPTDLNLGLEQMMKPLKIVGINSEELAMIISIALRYIPTLLDEANKIMLAQASRGVDFSEGKLKDKVMQIISLLVPMFIISFKRSDELANAMEARNFVPGNKRTRLHKLTWKGVDTVSIIFALSLLTSAIVLRIVT